MRRNRGLARDDDGAMASGVRSVRRARASSNDLELARELWEPIVCPECGTDHPDTVAIRLKRTGNSIEARCSDCGAVAARFTAGLWTS